MHTGNYLCIVEAEKYKLTKIATYIVQNFKSI